MRGGVTLDKEYFDILIFGHKTSKTRSIRLNKKTFKIGAYLLALVFLSATCFLCDYIQIKKKVFELNRLREETEHQRSYIQFFSARIEDLENQLSRLKEFDNKIRIIANLERSQEAASLTGIGGPSPSDIREKLERDRDQEGLIQQMRSDVERLQSEAWSREESLVELEKLLLLKKEMLAHTPSIRPVNGWLTSGFGMRNNPFTGVPQMHEGLDIANQVGTIIISPANGVVSDIGNDLLLGKVLVISHGFGINTLYGHLNKILVKTGQRVKRGDKIAELGATGKTTGPHLHYEVRVNGMPTNPLRYILN
jgi:murein DD-endopeptidase MepM/ murein hydrolase activator NlpD